MTLDTKNLSSAAKEIIMASWRPGTGKQYNSFLGRWEKFCAQKAIIVEEARNSQTGRLVKHTDIRKTLP